MSEAEPRPKELVVVIDCVGAGRASLNDLIPFQGKLKTLTDAKYQKLKASILKLGMSEPISVWQSEEKLFVVNGHQRVSAMQRMTAEGFVVPFVPVNYVMASSLKEAKLKVLALAGQYGEQTIESTREYLKENDLDIEDVEDFFSTPTVEIDDVSLGDTEVTVVPPEEEPEPANFDIKTFVLPGDEFTLGKHRLICGDATDPNVLSALMRGFEKPDMVLTDPPYGINANTKRDFNRPTGLSKTFKGTNYPPIAGDDSDQAAVDAFNQSLALDIAVLIFWGANHYANSLPQSPTWIVWDKRIEEKHTDNLSDAELAWVKAASKSVRIFRHLWKGMIKDSERGQARVHPTQKPVALFEWCISEYCPDAKVIMDYFGGSGSCLIAAQNLGKTCLMTEISPAYCQAILNRWAKATGQDPERVSDGRPWSMIKSEEK